MDHRREVCLPSVAEPFEPCCHVDPITIDLGDGDAIGPLDGRVHFCLGFRAQLGAFISVLQKIGRLNAVTATSAALGAICGAYLFWRQ